MISLMNHDFQGSVDSREVVMKFTQIYGCSTAGLRSKELQGSGLRWAMPHDALRLASDTLRLLVMGCHGGMKWDEHIEHPNLNI